MRRTDNAKVGGLLRILVPHEEDAGMVIHLFGNSINPCYDSFWVFHWI